MSDIDRKKSSCFFSAQHPWKWRFIASVSMLLLSLLGVFVTFIKQEYSWDYWRLLAVIFALISLGLSAYLKKVGARSLGITVWHEIFHWFGLILSIGLLSNLVHLGVLSPLTASLQTLILIALATFLAGVYIETTFIFIGALMGAFTLLLSYISLYSYLFFIPLSLFFLAALYLFIRRKSRES